MHIILLEPDTVLAKLLTTALHSAGHHVRLAVTAQDAILLADAEMPELIIMEIQLVSHSGIEFLYELRSYGEWQHIPVIAHSYIPPGEFSESWQLLHDELGVTRYLYKPRTSLQQLLRAVKSLAPQSL